MGGTDGRGRATRTSDSAAARASSLRRTLRLGYLLYFLVEFGLSENSPTSQMADTLCGLDAEVSDSDGDGCCDV